MKTINIALLGFGTVGLGAYEIIEKNKEKITKEAGCNLEVSKIYARSPKRLEDAKVSLDKLCTNPEEIFEDKNIDIVVEVMGGLEPATSLMTGAMEHGKAVVTANKKALATNWEKLIKSSEDNKAALLYEASVGGGIPIINSMDNALSSNNITRILGILNGTTNYILSKMYYEGKSYDEVLRIAQEKGFAEADPTSDVSGEDARYKLVILIANAFGKYIKPENISMAGIEDVSLDDIANAKKKGQVPKLIARADVKDDHITASVGVEYMQEGSPLASVRDEYNAILLTGDFLDDVMYYGKGAGAHPTGSAIVTDIITIAKSLIRM